MAKTLELHVYEHLAEGYILIKFHFWFFWGFFLRNISMAKSNRRKCSHNLHDCNPYRVWNCLKFGLNFQDLLLVLWKQILTILIM